MCYRCGQWPGVLQSQAFSNVPNAVAGVVNSRSRRRSSPAVNVAAHQGDSVVLRAPGGRNTYQCTRQAPPFRRLSWMKLMHSLKCCDLVRQGSTRQLRDTRNNRRKQEIRHVLLCTTFHCCTASFSVVSFYKLWCSMLENREMLRRTVTVMYVWQMNAGTE